MRAKDGVEHRGRLADTASNSLIVERHLSSGTISYEVSNSEVESVLVAYR